jgi:hypothetical protein
MMEHNPSCSMDILYELRKSLVLVEDWCGAFKGVRGRGEKKVL